MSVSHVAYGLRFAASTSLPGLPVWLEGVSDVRIRLKEQGTFSWEFPESAGATNLLSSDPSCSRPNFRFGTLPGGTYFGLFYGDGARFAVERTGREVWADWPENYAFEDACTYLVGPVMGLVLRLRGTVCLHSSAVAIDGHAVALVGAPGAGKSTTAAVFARSGFPVLSDDIVALADRGTGFLVQPGYPRVNLWPDSVCELFGSEEALPRITPTWDKRYLPLDQGHRFVSSPLPLGAIYILDGRDLALTVPVIEELSGKEAFLALVAHTYMNYLRDQDMRRAEFDVLTRIVSEIPIRKVRSVAEPSAIFHLCERIGADAARVMVRAPANISSVQG